MGRMLAPSLQAHASNQATPLEKKAQAREET